MAFGYPIIGPPGAQTPIRTNFRRVFEGNGAYLSLPGGAYIDGIKSYDFNNTYYYDLEPGLLMGIETATGGFAPAVIGVLQQAQNSGDTSLTVTPAMAAGIVYRLGTSGSMTLTGAPTPTGTVVQATVTFSNVNLTTGVITITALGANIATGSYLGDTDGSQNPVTFIPDGSGMTVVNEFNVPVAQVQFPVIPVGGVIATPGSGPNTGLLNYPASGYTSLITWLQDSLSTLPGGKFVFMSNYSK